MQNPLAVIIKVIGKPTFVISVSWFQGDINLDPLFKHLDKLHSYIGSLTNTGGQSNHCVIRIKWTRWESNCSYWMNRINNLLYRQAQVIDWFLRNKNIHWKCFYNPLSKITLGQNKCPIKHDLTHWFYVYTPILFQYSSVNFQAWEYKI